MNQLPLRPPPRDPLIRGLVDVARASALSRRSLLGLGAGGAAMAALAACAPPLPPSSAAKIVLPTDVSATDKIVRWANWTAYLDYDDTTQKYPTLEEFMAQTGITVEYSEDIEDNDSYFNKIAPQLRQGQDIQRDIFTFTDWMANRVIQAQLCQPLELITMPNAPNLLDSLKTVSFDPGRTYSLTWQSGFAGIGYNKERLGRELRTLDDLWQDDLKGKIVVLSEFRDSVGVVMQSQGVDISSPSWGKTEFENAVAEIEKRMDQGYIRRIKGNSYLEDLKSGNALAGIVWSGDLFILRAETGTEAWEFTIPETGGTLWSDNMMVPITSTHRTNAQTLMNYYYDPAVAAQVAAFVNYVCPVQGAQEELAKTDPDLAQNPFIFPTADYITQHNIQGFRALTPEEDAEYSAIWQKVMGN